MKAHVKSDDILILNDMVTICMIKRLQKSLPTRTSVTHDYGWEYKTALLKRDKKSYHAAIMWNTARYTTIPDDPKISIDILNKTLQLLQKLPMLFSDHTRRL